jgi:DNA-binding NtrC family response regulator
LEILLVVDNEAAAQALSTTLQRAGHAVTASTTIAGTVETLMRRGPSFDVIITSTRFDNSLGEDAVQYGRKFAAHAQVIALHPVSGDVEDIERALTRQSIPDRLQTMRGWN